MPFLRPQSYFDNRFHQKQEISWVAYKAGKDLVLPWGRRSGKSDLAIEILIEDIEEYGKDCLYVAKTQKQARKIVWKKLKKRLKENKDWRLKESSLECEHIPSGASIFLYGADIVPDNMTGSGYRVIVCDEYALWKKPEIVQLVLSPMLGDYNGQIIFASTKRGKNHFYELQERAQREPEKYFTIEATIFDNSFLTDAGREKVLSEYPGREKNPLYRQEILNQYVAFEGMVFAIPEDDYIDKLWHPADFDHAYHWRGMDHGFSPDPTACVWIAYNERKGYFQVYSEYKEQALLIKQHADIIQSQVSRTFVDSVSDIDPQIIAEYEAVGLALTPADKKDKKARLLKLVNALRIGKLKVASNCKQLLAEMQSLTWEQVEKKQGNDHLIDALDYGFNSIIIPEKPQPEPISEPLRFANNNEFSHQNFDD